MTKVRKKTEEIDDLTPEDDAILDEIYARMYEAALAKKQPSEEQPSKGPSNEK